MTEDTAIHDAAARGFDATEKPVIVVPEVEREGRFSDDALAARFTKAHEHDLRYVAAWNTWLIWTGSVWTFDNTMRAFNFARAVCREAAREASDPRIAVAIASAKTIAAVERLAKADRAHAATIDQWDADPWLLNTPGGMVDLRTGHMRPHRPEDYCTKITAVAPGGECPRWLKFLGKITGDDRALQDFMMCVAGYSLTGSTREHALFFGHGTGGNGKGVFLNTYGGIMGGYATAAPMETFTASKHDHHPTELARLRGARFVTAQETEEGRPLAEAKIKMLTGGDPVPARFMRQDFFTYTPTFKLFIAGNHRPRFRGVDESIRRRLHLIPFSVTIPKEEKDLKLTEKLKAEWPGILAWAIKGCLRWQIIGLSPPPSVTEATGQYLEAEDTLGTWIGERCKPAGYGGTPIAILFDDWEKWAKAEGEEPGSKKLFSQKLQDRGYKSGIFQKQRGLGGLALAHTAAALENPGNEPVGQGDDRC